jgi:hypothetical protein
MKKTRSWILLLLVISLLPLQALFGDGLFEGHDTRDHVVRITQFYQNLQEGTLIPRWGGGLNWGYGHPVLMFLYPLPSYTASLFRFVGFSFVMSTKLVFAVAYIASGLTMFVFMREVLGGGMLLGKLRSERVNQGAFVAALLYLFAPYRFVDLYVRGALGEHVFFIWPPLVLWFLLKYVRTRQTLFGVGVSAALAAMLLSHNALSIMYLPVIGVFWIGLELVGFRGFRVFFYDAFFWALGIGLSAFFLLPAFFEGKYTLRDIVTEGVTLERFETFDRILYSPWSFGGTGQLSVQLGVVQWLFVGLGIVWLFREFRGFGVFLKNNWFILLWLCALVVSIFLMIESALPVYERVTILQKFQFPWRWLSLALFAPAVVGGWLVGRLGNLGRFGKLGYFIFCFAVVGVTIPYWSVKSYAQYPESYFTSVYHGTTDTGESSPIWSVRFMEKEPITPYVIVEGEAIIKELGRSITSRSYEVTVSSERARLLENTLYFPGWFISVDGTRLSLIDVWYQDPDYRGLINFHLDQGTHIVKIGFESTKLRWIADLISLGSFASMGLILIYAYAKKHRSL